MDLFQAVILGIVQGITEFLPISSSGHLIIVEQFMGLEMSELKSFDVAVHVGTLFTILFYFRADVWKLLKSFIGLFGKKELREKKSEELIWFIILGTIPAVIVGFTLEDQIDGFFRDSEKVAMAMLLVAGLFIISELIKKRFYKENKSLSLGKVMFIGLMQAMALIPGVSRSGSTISAGLMGGLDREEAARFSFLLGIPAIAGAGILTALNADSSDLSYLVLFVGFISAFLSGLLSVSLLMKFLKNHSLMVFAVYLAIFASGIWYF